jgi:hypothetical protein
MNPLDKEELIHVIIRYWGLGEKQLILKERKEGNETLEWLLSSGKLVAEQDKRYIFLLSW